MEPLDGTPERAPGLPRAAPAGLWLLPVYGLLLALSTLTHEPDHTTDFGAWSEYVTTDRFLVSHMVASVLGAGLGMTGVAAAVVFLVRGRAPVAALIGGACSILGNTLFVALFSIAAFTQPAIGRAFLGGDETMRDFYDEVYDVPLLLNLAVGAPLFVAGAVLLGLAFARTAPGLRWAGYGYAASLTVFLVSAFTFAVIQPVAGAALAVAGVVIARRLPGAVTEPRTGTSSSGRRVDGRLRGS